MCISTKLCLGLRIRAKHFWCYFLSVMSAVILAHLVLHTSNCLFTPSFHRLMLSGTFRLQTLFINSTGTIFTDV